MLSAKIGTVMAKFGARAMGISAHLYTRNRRTPLVADLLSSSALGAPEARQCICSCGTQAVRTCRHHTSPASHSSCP